MKYLNGLYADGLIDPFSYKHDTLIRLANDTRDILGCFASQSITDVILQANPELINDFSHITPLTGPDGARSATVRTPLPKPAGVITSSCQNPEAVFKLFDLMLSEEAFLIGRYGEENVDWVTAGAADLNFYGTSAAVRVVNQLQDVAQNKHINELCPFYAYPKYADSVTYLGFDTLYEYENARAYQAYEPFKRETNIKALSLEYGALAAFRQPIDSYTDESIRAFITGEADPSDDAAWAAHLQRYEELGVQNLIDYVTEEM